MPGETLACGVYACKKQEVCDAKKLKEQDGKHGCREEKLLYVVLCL